MSTSIFMETSIQIERLFGHSQKAREIDEAIKNEKALTSRYVLAEFKSTVLKDFVFLYAVVKDEGSITDADAHIKRNMACRPKRQARCSHILVQIAETAGFNKEKVLARIERYIEWELIALFEEPIEYIPDEIECYIADVEPEFSYGRYLFNIPCTKDIKRCKADRFLGERKDAVKEVGYYLEKLPNLDKELYLDKELSGLKSLCPLLYHNPDRIRERNNCKKSADMMISLESPSDSQIFTSNLKHFKPILKALKKPEPKGRC